MGTRSVFISLALFFLAMGIFPSLLFSQAKVLIPGGTDFDFGDVFTGAVAKRSVTIQNTGDENLTITSVSTSCGCTATMLSKEIIPPGDSGKLEISFDSKKFTGKVEKAVTFDTNDPDQKRVRIIFHANISRIIETSLDRIVYNVIKVGADMVQEVTITNVSNEPLKITSVKSDSDVMKVQISEKELRPGYRTTLTCTLRATEIGFVKGNITFTTDNPKVASYSIRYFGLAKADK